MTGTGLQPSKQRQKKHTKGTKRHTDRRTSRLTVDTCTERVNKNEVPYVLLLMKKINNK